ncbi:VOC family protein [Leeia sp.]|uniref:VOC family protein n=1 Tax=Leeia sp. TaxID=2884678 RepID=UPI0035ADA723
MMKLGYTIFYVHDVKKSLAFYQAAFGFDCRFLHESGDWGELETGTTTLAFCSHALLQQMGKRTQAPDPLAACSEIALVTEDVAAAVERACQAGATLRQSPEEMPWGQITAYVSDPDGFLVEICTAVG